MSFPVLRVPSFLLVLAVIGLPAAAWTHSAPFNVSGGFEWPEHGSTTRADWGVTPSNPAQVWARVFSNYADSGLGTGVPGSTAAYAILGAVYTTHSGALLSSGYSDHVDYSVNMNVIRKCGSGSLGEGWLTLLQYKAVGGSWQLEKSIDVEGHGCNGESLPPFHTNALGGSFDFAPGNTYAMAIRAYTWEVSNSGNLAYIYAGGNLNSIRIDAPLPVVRANDVSVSYLTNLLSGTRLTGSFCDYDGSIQRVEVNAPGGSPNTAATDTNVPGCGSASSPGHRYTLWGQYTWELRARNDEGQWGLDTATVNVNLLGASASAQVPVDASRVEVFSWLGPDGEILGEDVRADGISVGSWGEAAGAHAARVSIERPLSLASVVLDGEVVWAASYEQVGEQWWEIASQAGSATSMLALEGQRAIEVEIECACDSSELAVPPTFPFASATIISR